MKTASLTTFAGAALLTLAACGVSPDATYRSAEDLASALDSEGFRCEPASEPATIADGYGEEIQCDTGMGVSNWEDDLPDHAQDPGLLFLIGGQMTGKHYVLHDTWAISVDRASHAEAIQEVFGGELVEPDREMMDLIGQ